MVINRLSDDNKGIAIISDNTESEDISYCEDCSLYRKKLHRLVPLITLEDEPLSPDYDKFKQCCYCYKIVPIYEVRQEGTLFTDLEGVKSPFDFGVTKMEGIHEKGLKNRLKQIAKKNKIRKEEYSKDQEVMNEVKQGAVITHYSSNM